MKPDYADDLVVCPQCGKTATMENFDVIGADGDNIFCTECHCEFNPDTKEIAGEDDF